MAKRPPRSGLLSRIAAPLAKAARKVVGRNQDEWDENEVHELMEAALAEADKAPARMTDDNFRLFAEKLAKQEDGAFQVKLHVVSLVEFHEAVGDKWPKLAEKVLMIAEGVINAHIGASNIFCRQGADCFVLIFRTCDNSEGRRRALIIAQELGTRLVGDQFVGGDIPLALAAEVSLEDGLNPDGSFNLAAIDNAVGEMRSIIAAQVTGAQQPRAWMRPGANTADKGGVRRHLRPGEAPQRQDGSDAPPPIPITDEVAPKSTKDPEWKPLEVSRPETLKDPTWVILEGVADRPAPSMLDTVTDPWATTPLPADAKLSLVWRPTWVAAGEVIGAYEAYIQRQDQPGATPIEGTRAYPKDDEPAANTLDRFRIAGAIRDFRASETAGNSSTVVVPIHWLTMTSDNRMEFLAPFADVTKEMRGARLVIELFGVPADVKPMILGTVVARARELCRMVLLRTSLAAPRAALALDAGAAMVGVDLAELAGGERIGDDDLLAALKAFNAAAGKTRLGSYVWGVRRRKVIVGTVQAGFAMVNGPALMKNIAKPARQLPAPKSRFVQT